MSKKASKGAVGAFVVGAMVLAVAAILVFGSGNFFKQTYKYVLFFESSVKGLNVGAPVVLHGVEIGRVKHISLDSAADGLSFKIPVIIEIDGSKFDYSGATVQEIEAAREVGMEVYLQRMYAKGLRARLISQSILTGQLMIELRYLPPQDRGKEVNSVSYYRDYPVIPTTVAPIDNALEKLTHIPFDAIADNLTSILEELKKIVSDKNAEKMMKNLADITGELRSVIGSEEAKRLVLRVDELLSTSISTVNTLNTALPQTLKELQNAIENLQTVINPASPQSVNMATALQETGKAARSIRELADMLRQNPDALLFGKGAR